MKPTWHGNNQRLLQRGPHRMSALPCREVNPGGIEWFKLQRGWRGQSGNGLRRVPPQYARHNKDLVPSHGNEQHRKRHQQPCPIRHDSPLAVAHPARQRLPLHSHSAAAGTAKLALIVICAAQLLHLDAAFLASQCFDNLLLRSRAGSPPTNKGKSGAAAKRQASKSRSGHAAFIELQEQIRHPLYIALGL